MQTVYADAEVARAARHARLVALRVDLTRPHPVLQRRLVAWGGTGLPFAIVFDADGRVVKRLSGLFTAKTLIMTLRRVTTNGEKDER